MHLFFKAIFQSQPHFPPLLHQGLQVITGILAENLRCTVIFGEWFKTSRVIVFSRSEGDYPAYLHGIFASPKVTVGQISILIIHRKCIYYTLSGYPVGHITIHMEWNYKLVGE